MWVIQKIYAVECWEDSFGGGNTWIVRYFTTQKKAERCKKYNEDQGDKALHYSIKEITVL